MSRPDDLLLELHAAFAGNTPAFSGAETPVARFHAVKHALDAASRVPGLQQRGRALARAVAAAIGAAWRPAALDPARFTFGSAWPAEGWWDRASGTTALRPNAIVWPADDAGTVIPLLAVDAFLDDLIERGRTESLAAATTHLEGTDAADGDVPQAPPSLLARPAAPTPFVSVIVVNWNGREHLDSCFASLAASTWPADRREVVLVDNGSTDGSAEYVSTAYPWVRLVRLPENLGFTGGNAAGVAAARGDVLVFLNNDMRVEPDMLTQLVGALADGRPCAAAQVLSWDGAAIDFVRGTINFEARGFQEHYGSPFQPDLAATADTFFANGGAFAMTRALYDATGGFDEHFFAYYDDVDLGWAVRLLGADIAVATRAVAYHRHGATSGRQPAGQKRFLMERNALWTAMKRYETRTLERLLPAILLLAVRRIVGESTFSFEAPALRDLASLTRRSRRPGLAALTPRGAGALLRCPVDRLAGLGAALADLPRVHAQRVRAQASRRSPDRAILPLFGRPLEYISSVSSYRAAQDALVDALALDGLFAGRARVLIITHEPLGAKMSGPAVRALEMGRALAAKARVTVATPFEPGLTDDRCTIAPYSFTDQAAIRRLAEQADVLVLQGFTLARYPFLLDMQVKLVVDLYCPFTVEYLESASQRAEAEGAGVLAEAEIQAHGFLTVQNTQLRHGDFFLCASERQRDFWLGALHTAGRLNPATYTADPTLRRLIDVVPFGVPQEAFADATARGRQARGGPLRSTFPGLSPHDRVILWGGSVLDWQDPQALVRAVARLAATHPDVKLVFMGTRHPNPQIPAAPALHQSIAIARELDVLDRHVFFNDWVPYEERAAWLADAAVGVSTHRDHLETRLSFRTRILDYLWARLPIVCTEGDFFADLVRERGLGLTVPPGDVDALAAALARVMDDEAFAAPCRDALAEVADGLRWDRVVAPLASFCAAPRFAPDREPAIRSMRRSLEQGFKLTKALRRAALSAGLSEGRIEQVKQWRAVRATMKVRNTIALARARRRR